MLGVSQRMRRKFGPFGGAGSKDVSLLGNGQLGGSPSPNLESHESRLAHRGAKKKLSGNNPGNGEA